MVLLSQDSVHAKIVGEVVAHVARTSSIFGNTERQLARMIVMELVEESHWFSAEELSVWFAMLKLSTIASSIRSLPLRM